MISVTRRTRTTLSQSWRHSGCWIDDLPPRRSTPSFIRSRHRLGINLKGTLRFRRALSEANENDCFHQIVSLQKPHRLVHGNSCGAIHWKAVCAGADRWERHGLDAVLFNQRETTPIAVREQIVLAALATVPNRPDRVDDPFGREPITARDFCLARGATAQITAFGKKFGTRRTMNRTV